MPPTSPELPIEWTFHVGDETYSAELKRGSIIHEAFHAALPQTLVTGHQLVFRTEDGTPIYPDNFLGEIADHLGTTSVRVVVSPIPESAQPNWRNVGIDHLAITVEDRDDARDFLEEVIQMTCVRHDPHLTCMTTGATTLMLFDAGQNAPLSTGRPSEWHHIGFVVDDLSAAYAHLHQHRDRIMSDFAMLERDERWSLYFFYRNGDVTLMFQFSEVKSEDQGITHPERADFHRYLYDYAQRPYGVQWELEAAHSGSGGTS